MQEIRWRAKGIDGDRSAFLLLSLIAGVWGILLLLCDLEGISYSGWIVYPVAAAVCGGEWYLYGYHKRTFWPLILLLALFYGGICFLFRERIQAQGERIAEGILGKNGLEDMSVTETVALLAILLSVFCFMVEYVLHRHRILYILTTVLLLLSPLVSVRLNPVTVILLFFFQFAFRGEIPKGRRRKNSFLPDDGRIAKKNRRQVWVFLPACVLLAVPAVLFYSQELYDITYRVEGYVYRSVNRLSGKAAAPVTGGRIDRGNQYHMGVEQITLEASRQPTETLYLRGFGGGEYIGGDWIRSSDEELFEKMAEKLEGHSASDISSVYYSMYYDINEYYAYQWNWDELASSILLEGLVDSITLTVRHSNEQYETIYVPYCSKRNGSGAAFFAAGLDGINPRGYTFSYFEQKDMNPSWRSDEALAMVDLDIEEAYLEAAKEAYTKVPVERLPRMAELVAEHPLDSLDEITAFILYTLSSRASYTMTPGWAPLNEDIAEYFLFESGQGYCQHFALAATLLYRMYGIPARYATGYRVSPSDFKRKNNDSMFQPEMTDEMIRAASSSSSSSSFYGFEPTQEENHTWYAQVTDESAHAWVEIFLEGFGWTPVEVTPSGDGSISAHYPGFDTVTFDRIVKEQNWSFPLSGQSAEKNAEELDGALRENGGWQFDLQKHEKEIWVLVSLLLYNLLLIPVFLDHRRLKGVDRLAKADCREIFTRLMAMLHYSGYLKGYCGEEEDFARKLAEDISAISEEEAIRLQEVVVKAAYSSHVPEWEDSAYVRKMYVQAAECVYGNLKWYRKLVFRYFKGFL